MVSVSRFFPLADLQGSPSRLVRAVYQHQHLDRQSRRHLVVTPHPPLLGFAPCENVFIISIEILLREALLFDKDGPSEKNFH